MTGNVVSHLLGALYLLSGFSKIRQLCADGAYDFEGRLRFIGFDRRSALVLKYMIPVVEVGLAVVVLTTFARGLLLSMLFLFVVTVFGLRAPESGPKCLCFGGVLEFGGTRKVMVLRNALLAMLSVAALAAEYWGSTSEALELGPIGALAALAAIGTFVVLERAIYPR